MTCVTGQTELREYLCILVYSRMKRGLNQEVHRISELGWATLLASECFSQLRCFWILKPGFLLVTSPN